MCCWVEGTLAAILTGNSMARLATVGPFQNKDLMPRQQEVLRFQLHSLVKSYVFLVILCFCHQELLLLERLQHQPFGKSIPDTSLHQVQAAAATSFSCRQKPDSLQSSALHFKVLSDFRI
ncbi:unnamed protein product [Eretmochelys imbricata]